MMLWWKRAEPGGIPPPSPVTGLLAGRGTGRLQAGSLRTRSQSAPAFFLGTINLFPEDFVHVPEFAVRNTETTVGMGSVAI